MLSETSRKQCLPLHPKDPLTRWPIYNINARGALVSISNMHKRKIIKEIQWTKLSYICFQAEDEALSSKLYFRESTAKLCHACPSRYMGDFEQLFLQKIFNLVYLNDFEYRGRKISQKAILFKSCLSQKLKQHCLSNT